MKGMTVVMVSGGSGRPGEEKGCECGSDGEEKGDGEDENVSVKQ